LVCFLAISNSFRLHKLFTSNMVLQRGQRNPIYGSSTRPNQEIKVLVKDATYTTRSDGNSKFSVFVESAFSAKDPHTITILEDNVRKSVLENVWFGDVFVCSGQSNMDWPISISSNPQLEVEESLKYPNVRVFKVAIHQGPEELEDFRDGVTSGWHAPSRNVSPGFSAVCFTFGTYLNKKLGVAIGLLHSSVGGSPIEMWMSKTAHRECNGTQPAQNYWNVMLHPLLKQRIVGGLWYQGESNAGRFVQYDCQFQSMVKDWRKMFSSNFAFFSVQLAGFNGDFREIRYVQHNLIKKIQLHGMATAIDLGHPTDIHPKK